MSAAIFVVIETKTNSFSFCSSSDIVVRRLTFSLHEILCNHFLAFRICSQKGGNKKQVLTNLKCGMKTLRMSR